MSIPVLECGHDGILERVFSEFEITQVADEARQRASPRLADDLLDGRPYLLR